MTKHKWYNEIVAWASGAEIEYFDELQIRWLNVLGMPRWDSSSEYRIKPQPKEPQYLYVYADLELDISSYKICRRKGNFGTYLGKIKLENDDD